MCVDELNVLQSRRAVEPTCYVYVDKLTRVNDELSNLTVNVTRDYNGEVKVLNLVIAPIYNLMLQATGIFKELNISRPSQWKLALLEINNVKRVSYILGYAPGRIGAICRILATKTTVDETVFLSTEPHKRDGRMCSILSNISTALSALNTGAGGNYFNFLGERGSTNMLNIIDILA